MKAAICTQYGPPEVLQLREIDDPVAGAEDVLIRIRATTVTPSDCYIRSMIPSAPLVTRLMARCVIGFKKPRRQILGAVLAGEIEAIGTKVSRFQVGERVWAFTLLRMGCYAERAVLPATFKLLTLAPSTLSFEEAAALPSGGLLAFHFLSKANIRPGQHVLVYGASGANGTCAIQLARHLGAEVTAVCGASNAELARSLGANTVLDYANDHASALGRYDVVFDAVGRRKSSALKTASRRALTPSGRVISVDDAIPRLRADALTQLTTLAEAGKLRPVIDRRYRLDQIAEAHRYVEQGHKKGNVVITIA